MGISAGSLAWLLRAASVIVFTVGCHWPWFVAEAAPGAPATPKTSSLSWTRLDGTNGCIGTRELAQAVQQLLGRAVFVSPAHAELSVEGWIERRQEAVGWHVVLTMWDGDGTSLGRRELHSAEESCRSLDEPVSLAIALMIDPDAMLRAGEPEPEPSPPTEQPVPVQPACPPVTLPRAPPGAEPAPTPSPEDNWSIGARAGPLLGFGLLPGVGVGLVSTATVEPPWFIPVEGSLAAFANNTQEVAGAYGSFSLQFFGLALCPVALENGGFGLVACAETQLGAMRVDGSNFDTNREDSSLVCNLATRVRLGYRIVGPVVVETGLAGVLPLVRDRYLYLDAAAVRRELFRMSPVAAQVDINVGLRFP